MEDTAQSSSLRHTQQFHTLPQGTYRDLTSYTVFHGSPTFAGTERIPPYVSLMSSQRLREGDAHAPVGFSATGQHFVGPNGEKAYKFGMLAANRPTTTEDPTTASTITAGKATVSCISSPYGRGIPVGGLRSTESPYGGSRHMNSVERCTATLGSTGLPPHPYKPYLTEHVDEYRNPVEHLDTLHTLTQKFNTQGGYRTLKQSTRSDKQPSYESRVNAF